MAENNYDWQQVEKQLQEQAKNLGVQYDPSDLEDVQRHTGYDVGGSTLEGAVGDAMAKYQQRASNTPNSGGGSAPKSVTQSWSGPQQQQAPGVPDWYQKMFDQLQGQMTADRQARDAEAAQRQQALAAQQAAAAQAEAQRVAQRDALYGQLLGRAQQGLNVSAADPIIAGQTAAYSAQQQRARQNYLADLAESAGPLANTLGEQRLSAERQGAQTAQFQADLMGRELSARRDEIAGALQSMQGLLTAEQQSALQRELGLLNNAVQQRTIDVTSRGQDINQMNAMLQGAISSRGQDIDWQQSLMQNQLQWQIEQLRNEQAMRDLSLRAEDRAAYWDMVRGDPTFGR